MDVFDQLHVSIRKRCDICIHIGMLILAVIPSSPSPPRTVGFCLGWTCQLLGDVLLQWSDQQSFTRLNAAHKSLGHITPSSSPHAKLSFVVAKLHAHHFLFIRVLLVFALGSVCSFWCLRYCKENFETGKILGIVDVRITKLAKPGFHVL
jgi:hypothetical protein